MLQTVVEVRAAYWPYQPYAWEGGPRWWAEPDEDLYDITRWAADTNPRRPYRMLAVVPTPMQAGTYNLRWSRCPNTDDRRSMRERNGRWACEADVEFDIRDWLDHTEQPHLTSKEYRQWLRRNGISCQ